MTRTIITSSIVLRSLASETTSPERDDQSTDAVLAGVDNGSGSWLALAGGELVRSGDLRICFSVNGDGVQVDASWSF